MSSHSRHTFLDLFRGLFVLLMVEGHCVRVVLDPASRSSFAFDVHEILHGITAPGFLFTSGFALAIASHRKRDQLQSLSPALGQRLWRGFALILLGYALHLPYWSITKTLTASTAGEWRSFIAFGVLQLIGTVIIVIRLLFLAVRSNRLFLIVLSTLFLVAVYLTPLMWDPQVSAALPDMLAASVNSATGSPFPLFPFAAFFIAGTVVSWIFLDQASRRGERSFMVSLAIAGGVCLAGGLGSSFLPVTPLGETDFWYTSPSYVWIRLGVLLLLMSLFWVIEDRLRQAPRLMRFRPQWIATLGRESYFVYVIHLFIIFGWLLNPFLNIEEIAADRLAWFPALFMSLVLVGALGLLSSAWHLLKKEHPIIVQGLLSWFWLTTVYYILINPF